jgi:hypothetical protein
MSDLRETDPALRELRQRAERQASEEGPGPEGLSPAEAARLVHELRVHQIELEMQNDELRQTQARLEKSRGQYANLYDFAPMGYLTLDGLGRVIEATLPRPLSWESSAGACWAGIFGCSWQRRTARLLTAC